MAVKSLPTSLLTPGELASFVKGVYSILKLIPQDDRFSVKLVLEEAANEVAELEKFSKLKGINIFTNPLLDADMKRDSIYVGLLRFLRGAKELKIETIANFSHVLYRLFEQHNPKLYKASYANESHHLNALLLDLSKDEFQEAIGKLNLTQSIADLKQAQADFEALYVNKVGNKAADNWPQLVELITPIRERITELLVCLGIAERHSPENYTQKVEEINQMVTEYNAKAHARKTRKSGDDETEPVIAETVTGKN